MNVLRDSSEGWRHCHAVVRPALRLAPSTYLQDLQDRLAADGVQVAVIRRDTATLFDWVVRLLARQGIGNHAAEVFLARHGGPTFAKIAELMETNALCPRLCCHWTFAGCHYRRSTGSCSTPHHRVGCPVTLIPARKGARRRGGHRPLAVHSRRLRRRPCRVDRQSPCRRGCRQRRVGAVSRHARGATGATDQHRRHRVEGLVDDPR